MLNLRINLQPRLIATNAHKYDKNYIYDIIKVLEIHMLMDL